VEDVESQNSRAVIELGLDEIPSTSGDDSSMLHLSIVEVSPFHVIFDLNEVLITTHFENDKYGKGAFDVVSLRHGLKEFLKKCLVQFHIYIWFTA
jgi:hypothetical protein